MKYYLINLIIFFLPHSRCFSFKRKLLRWAGCSIEENVRVMRIRVAGINLKIGKNTFIGDETILFGTVGTNIKIWKKAVHIIWKRSSENKRFSCDGMRKR